MLRFLFLLGIAQSLEVLSNAQQDLSNRESKYNGPSHQYLPAAMVNKKHTLPISRDSVQRFHGSPQYNGFPQQNQNLQSQASNESGKFLGYALYTIDPYHSQQSPGIEYNSLTQAIRETSYYQNPDHHNNYPYSTSGQTQNPSPSTVKQHALYKNPSGKSYLAFIVPPPSTSTQRPTPPPTPIVNATQASKHYNHPPRKSQLAFIIPENTTAGAGSTTTAPPSYTSRYHGPSNQYLPAATETSSQTSSPPYYATPSHNFASPSNNHPWTPIQTEHPTTKKMSKTGPSPVALRQGYRYNTPAQSHLSTNSQIFNGINYNELGMGLNSTAEAQQVIGSHPDSRDKTEVQTQQGYVYGQPDSSSSTESQAITHLNPVPTIPSSYNYYRPGQRFKDNPAIRYQTQQGFMGIERPLKEAHSIEKPASSPKQYEQQSVTDSFPTRNGNREVNLNHSPIQTQQEANGSLGSPSKGFKQPRLLLDQSQYKQQAGSNSYPNEKESYGKLNSAISPQKPMERKRPANEGSYQYTPSFGAGQDEHQIRPSYYAGKPANQEINSSLNVQQTLRKPVEDYSPSSGTTNSELQEIPHMYPNTPGVSSESHKDLYSQTQDDSRPSPFVLGQYDQHSRHTFIPSSADVNRIYGNTNANKNRTYDLTQNHLGTMGNLRPSSGVSSENIPPCTESYNQQQNKPETNKYYSANYPYPGTETFQSTLSETTPLSNDVHQAATSSDNTRPYDYPNLQYSSIHLQLPHQETQENNPISQTTPTDSQFSSPPQDFLTWHSTLPNRQPSLSHNSLSSNASPIPQEELQKYSLNKPISPLPLGLLPPTLTKLESQKYFIAGQDQFCTNSSHLFNQNSTNSEYQSYSGSNQVPVPPQDHTSLSPNSQGQIPQKLSGLKPLQTSYGYVTSHTIKAQQFGNKTQEVFNSERNTSHQGSLVFQSLHTDSEKLNTSQIQISQTNPARNFAVTNQPKVHQPTQSPSASSSEIQQHSTPSQYSFNSKNVATNFKAFSQSNTETHKDTFKFSQIPQNLAGSSHFSLGFQGYRPNYNEIQSISSTLPKLEHQKLNSSFNQLTVQDPLIHKQFIHQENGLGTEASYQQQQLFLGNPQNTVPQVPGKSTISSFFGASENDSNTASSPIGNSSSNVNPSKTVTSPTEPVNSLGNKNFLDISTHSQEMNPYYTMHPGYLAQGQKPESFEQPAHYKFRPMVFDDSPADVTPSPAETSKPIVFVESPPEVPHHILESQSHLVYGSPIQEPSNGYLPPSVVIQAPYLKK